MKAIALISFFALTHLFCFSQGLEEVFVETYYIADAEDEKDPSAQGLKAGMVTYRIWVDMKEGYKLLSVYGAPGHPLRLFTNTSFFNDTTNGSIKAPEIYPSHLGNNALLLDSYIAISGANKTGLAVKKEDDKDGSVVKPKVNTDNPTIIERGVLMSQKPDAGIPIREADGFMHGSVPALVIFGHDFAAFGNSNHLGEIEFDNGAWAVFKGLKGPFPEKNYLLIAQVTTDGDLSFELNLQIASPRGETEYYVARNPEEGQLTHPDLIFPKPDQSLTN